MQNILDFLKKAKRGPQVILPKDIGAIIAETGCAPGWKVVDAGTGSGYLALFLANLGCKVYSYEKEKRFFEVAKKNIGKSGLKVSIKNKDLTKGISEKGLDMICLDMEKADKVVRNAHKKLKKGGWIVVYSMHAEHLIKVRKEMEKYFGNIDTIEAVYNHWQFQSKGKKTWTRPKSWLLGHTGFLTIGRKT